MLYRFNISGMGIKEQNNLLLTQKKIKNYLTLTQGQVLY